MSDQNLVLTSAEAIKPALTAPSSPFNPTKEQRLRARERRRSARVQWGAALAMRMQRALKREAR